MIKYKKRDSLEGHGFAAAVFYGVCSASMAFLNKAVISSYEFPFPFFIMACQMMVTILFLEVLGSLGKVTLPHYTWRSARLFLAPSLGYAFHATLSLMALQGMNIPMYGAVKRCTPLVNLVLSVVILHRPFPSCTLISSILIITSGCFVAALGDLTIDTFAYTMGGLSVLAQGLYLTLVQQCAENKLSTLEILQLNSYNTLAPFIIVSVLNYSLFLCTALNSALTTSLVSVAKSVIQTLVGFFVFGGVKYHPLNITGIVMNTVGGFMYTYTKYQEGKKKYQKDENYNKLQLNGVVSIPREAPLIPNGIKRDEHSLSEIKVS